VLAPALAVATLGIGTPTSAGPGDDGWGALFGLFSRPDWDEGYLEKKDAYLHEEIAALLDQAVPGTEIRLVMPGWQVPDSQVDDEIVLEAIQRALDRGCHLLVIGPVVWENKHPDDPESKPEWFHIDANGKLKQRLDAMLGDRIRYWRSGNEVTSNINHNKYILLEEVRGAAADSPFVVLTATSNLRRPDIQRPNDAVLLAGNRPLFDAFWAVWTASWHATGREDPTPFPNRHDVPTLAMSVRFFPLKEDPGWSGENPDPVLHALDSVDCVPGASVHVTMATWFDAGRGAKVLDRLLDLADGGCDVRVLAHHELEVTGDEPYKQCTIAPLRDGIDPRKGYCETTQPVWDEMTRNGGIRWGKTASHSKYVLVEGPVEQDGVTQWRRIVVTGSANFATPIWYDSNGMTETVLVFTDNEQMWGQYAEHWNWLCRESWYTLNDPCGPRW
jgi:hypothetical protein